MDLYYHNFLIALYQKYLYFPWHVLFCWSMCLLPPRYRIITYFLVQLTLLIAFILTLPQFKEYPEPILTFSGHYVVDKLAVLSKLFMYLFSFFAFAYAREYIRDAQNFAQ